MTSKELFQRVKDHLLKQKVKSINSQGMCRYLDEKGHKCAIGCLIENYQPEMEAWPVEKVVSRIGLNEHAVLLFALQWIHDNLDNWEVTVDWAWEYCQTHKSFDVFTFRRFVETKSRSS